MTRPICPLCSYDQSETFHRDAYREYLRCPQCELIFAHPDAYLSRAEEFKRYEFHENDITDAGYRKFLQKMSEPLLARIAANSKGFDFGSGPGPLLKLMFEEQGHSMNHYDSFFTPDEEVFRDTYDFITATEVAEHLHNPLVELDRLWKCLKPGGYLGIMTSMRTSRVDFSSWHYIKDETHVVFFAPETMRWLAIRWQATLEILGESVVIFQKALASNEPSEGYIAP